MDRNDSVTIFTDGASRGNPGPAAFAYVIKRAGQPDVEVKEVLPETTNNVAEYTALVRALEHARRLEAASVNVCTDSELMVKQVQGSYRVKNEGLRPLFTRARDLIDGFAQFHIRHVPRAENAQADRLCNEALDGRARPKAAGRPAAAAAPLRAQARDEAIACLRGVAEAWASGATNRPRPEEVWDQLWSILEEAGLVRAK